MQAFEKLGAFYLGRVYDADRKAVLDDTLLYDARDLTTHAVCLGMTGSGKTGLCVTLLEEAAIDSIPAIAVDPKGDLGNLLLTFPRLQPSDFRPWVDEGEAARNGQDAEQYAASVARLWKKGLAEWGQDGSRIARLRDAADLAIYTPGSAAGRRLRVLRSFSAPPPAQLADADFLRDRLIGTVSGLLTLLGLDPDPIRSREQILLSNILQRSWEQGRDLDLAALIQQIQAPPFDRIGIMDLESFYPAGDRFAFSMSLNNLLASPAFRSWMEGEPLEIQRLLWTPEGKPRISVLSIAHLGESERMFFVTVLLNEIVTWMRSQPGSTSLRALLYMDEVTGYFPPTANPPSKAPMLTLLKQARAYGLGVVLASQNPVDLDYKGLSNAGTWFLGRMQTEQDKARVLDGLEGASSAAGFDRRRTEATLAGLKSRVFLLNNVHDTAPVLFHTRWALSYLRGPLTAAQIRTLAGPTTTAAPVAPPAAPANSAPATAAPRAQATSEPSGPPVLPAEISQFYFPARVSGTAGQQLVYRPALLGSAALHFVRATSDVDLWRDTTVLAPVPEEVRRQPWKTAVALETGSPEIEREGEAGALFSPLPAAATRVGSYKTWSGALSAHLYRDREITIWNCARLKVKSAPGESEGDFRARLGQVAREQRDLRLAKLEKKFKPKLERLQDRIRRASERIEREKSQYGQQKLQTAISVGATVLGALFGRKVASAGTVGRATTAMRGAGRAAREKGDVARAVRDLELQQQKLVELEREFEEEAESIRESADPGDLELKATRIRPRKSDITVQRVGLVWTPWRVGPGGIADPLILPEALRQLFR